MTNLPLDLKFDKTLTITLAELATYNNVCDVKDGFPQNINTLSMYNLFKKLSAKSFDRKLINYIALLKIKKGILRFTSLEAETVKSFRMLSSLDISANTIQNFVCSGSCLISQIVGANYVRCNIYANNNINSHKLASFAIVKQDIPSLGFLPFLLRYNNMPNIKIKNRLVKARHHFPMTFVLTYSLDTNENVIYFNFTLISIKQPPKR